VTLEKLAVSFVTIVAIAGCAPADEPAHNGSGGGGASSTGASTGPGTSTSGASTTSMGSSATTGTTGSAVTSGGGGSGGGAGTGAGGAAPDAGVGPDAGSDAQEGGTLPCPSDAFCDDFEKYTAGAKPGAPWSGQGSVDATKSVSGKNSLHVVSGGDNMFAMMKAPFFPPAGNEYYGRVMFWVDNVPNSHWTFVRSKGPVAGQTYSAEYTYGGSGKKYIANYDSQGVASDCWKDGGPLVVGKWVCMEWHFKGATNELELWIDGVADPAHVVNKGDGCIAHGTNDIWQAPTFNNLEIGFATYPTATTFNVWFDDLAVSKARVGCAR
jgi:hypothetical protein